MAFTTETPAARAPDAGRGSARQPAVPQADIGQVDLDVLKDLLSYYLRSLNLTLSRDLDHCMCPLPVARGTGKISTLLIVGANPGIRPSVVAHIIQKDRSAMVKLLDQLKSAGVLEQRVSEAERRSHELYLTAKGETLADRVRTIAVAQNDRFFSVLAPAERTQLLSLLKRLYVHHIDPVPASP